MRNRILYYAVITAVMAISLPLSAADTTETFDVGATDFELYLGFDGIGLEKYQRSLSGEAVMGFGFTEGFSGLVSVAGSSNEYFGDGGGEISFGIFGTPLDTDHVDLDLFLSAGFSADEFGLAPGLELNFDYAPDLAAWGVYLRVEEALAGRDESVEDDPATAGVDESVTDFAFAPVTAITLGAYWTVADGHQLLVEYDMSIANNPADGEDALDIGGVALGYNVALSDCVEMINQVYLDIPGDGEDMSAGVMTGIIVTLPSVDRPPTVQ